MISILTTIGVGFIVSFVTTNVTLSYNIIRLERLNDEYNMKMMEMVGEVVRERLSER